MRLLFVLELAAKVVLVKSHAVVADGSLLDASVSVRKHLPLELAKAILKARVQPTEHLPRISHLQVVDMSCKNQDDYPPAVHKHNPVQKVAVEQGNH